jgi:hypothetical protein
LGPLHEHLHDSYKQRFAVHAFEDGGGVEHGTALVRATCYERIWTTLVQIGDGESATSTATANRKRQRQRTGFLNPDP